MDIKQLRNLMQNGSSVVLVEDGLPPLLIRELADESRSMAVPAVSVPDAVPEEVPISSRWPKGKSTTQDQILERLNKEILALREQIAQEEGRQEGDN